MHTFINFSQHTSVADLRGVSASSEKKVTTSFLNYLSLTATSLSTSRAPKPTHQPYYKVIFAFHATN